MALTGKELGPFGLRVREALAPWMTPDLEAICAAIGAMGFNSLLELIEEEGTEGEPGWVPAWGKLGDPTRCPAEALGFLAGLVGVVLPVGCPEVEARALIKAESGLQRGTEASVKAAIERGISRFWAPDTEYLEDQLLRHESTPGSLLCYEATRTFTSGATFSAPGSAVTPPTLEPLSVSETGGELGPGLYYYAVTAIVAGEETGVSNERSFDAGGTNKWKAKLKWSAVPSATNYRVYRGSISGGEDVVHEVGAVTEYTDTGPGFTAGTPPEPLSLVNITEYYDLIPRTEPSGVSNAYWFLVVVNGVNLLPEGNAAQLEGYIRSVKPAGLCFAVVQVNEAIWDEATLTWNEVGAGVLWSTVTKEQIT